MALGDSVYLWNAGNGGITQLMQTTGEGSHVTSVAWSQRENFMAIGTSNNEVRRRLPAAPPRAARSPPRTRR